MGDVGGGHLVFAVGASQYAVPAETAAEVVTVPTVTRVPGAPLHVVGVFAHRGEVVPAIDLTALLGGQAVGEGRRAVLVRAAGQVIALLADKVHGVSTLTVSDARLGDSGPRAYLQGPAQGPAGDTVIIEPEGFVGFLSRG